MSHTVILLKSQPREPDNDAYVRQFLSSGYKPYFVEVLQSVLYNELRLEDTIRAGSEGYVCVVVTSSRAADAWIHALKNMDTPGYWTRIPFYVVGEATARTLKHIATLHPNHFSEKLIMGAAESGTSESLAGFILTDLSTRSGVGKLLYLTGDKNRDTFNRIMSEGGIEVESLCVYKTVVANDLEDNIDRIAREIRQVEKHVTSTWIVFFAPSSSSFALPHLRRHFQWSETDRPQGAAVGLSAKLAAIGPTTAKFLRTEQRLGVDAVAMKPTPEQLVQAIHDADKGLS